MSQVYSTNASTSAPWLLYRYPQSGPVAAKVGGYAEGVASLCTNRLSKGRQRGSPGDTSPSCISRAHLPPSPDFPRSAGTAAVPLHARPTREQPRPPPLPGFAAAQLSATGQLKEKCSYDLPRAVDRARGAPYREVPTHSMPADPPPSIRAHTALALAQSRI